MTDHDRLFKELLTTFFVEFVELFLPEMTKYLDPASLVAINNELFSDLFEGERRETDILMKAKFKDKDTHFLIHLENQSYSESDFNRRMFDYFTLIYVKFRTLVYPIALFSFDEPFRPEPDSYKMSFPDLDVVDFHFSTIQLNRLDWHDFINRPNPVASALMAKMKIAPEDRVKVKLECLKMLVGLELDPVRTYLISGFIDTYLRLNTEEQQEFQTGLAKIRPEEKEDTVIKIVTSWMEEGIEIGKRDLLVRQLKHRFGELSPEVEAHVRTLSETQVNDLAVALFDFSKREDLTGWLQNQPVEKDKQ